MYINSHEYSYEDCGLKQGTESVSEQFFVIWIIWKQEIVVKSILMKYGFLKVPLKFITLFWKSSLKVLPPLLWILIYLSKGYKQGV